MATAGEKDSFPLEDKEKDKAEAQVEQNVEAQAEVAQAEVSGEAQAEVSGEAQAEVPGEAQAEIPGEAQAEAEGDGVVSQGRFLQHTEMFYEAMQSQVKVSIYIHIAIFKSKVALEESIVRKSLQLLAKFQPLLHMKIVKETDPTGQDTMRYTEIEGEDFIELETIKISDTSAWVDISTRETTFDSEKGPLWKVVLGQVDTEQANDGDDDKVHSSAMVFFFHHAIIDAKGAVDLIYRQFLPILNGVLENGDLSAYETPLAVAAPFEDHFIPEKDRGKSAPWYMRLVMSFMRWKNRRSNKVEKPMIRSTEESYKDVTDTPLIPFIYSEELTEKIIQASKANGVTVHMTIMTALSHLAVALCKEQGITKPPKVLAHNITVDLRKRLNFETPQPMGIYVAAIMPKIKVTPEAHIEKDKFWIAAKNYGKEMKKQMHGDKYLKSTMGIYKYFLDATKTEQRPLTDIMNELGINFQLSVANLGNLDAGTTPSASCVELVEQYSNLQVAGMKGTSCTLAFFISTFRGKLTWLMNYIPEWISKDFACKYIAHLEDLFKRVCAPDEVKSEEEVPQETQEEVPQETQEAAQAESGSKDEAQKEATKSEDIPVKHVEFEIKEEAPKQDSTQETKSEEPATKQAAKAEEPESCQEAKGDEPESKQEAKAGEPECNEEAKAEELESTQEAKAEEPECTQEAKTEEPESTQQESKADEPESSQSVEENVTKKDEPEK